MLAACAPDQAGKRLTVKLQPFTGMKAGHVEFLKNELVKFNVHVVTNQPIELPPSAFNAARNRYRADSLINFLASRSSDGSVTLGLTNNDISTTKGSVIDWGVMGLSYCPGKSCIVSTFRLSAKNQQEQFFKVVIHELGHSQGLQHCPNTSCYMRDAEGGNPTDQEKEFCARCKARLKLMGWSFH
jgi:archaemetzincin